MFLGNFIPNNYTVIGRALIVFKATTKTELPYSDWLFFTSKNAVKHFFSLGYEIGNRKIACVGSGTYKVLIKYCKQVHYIGNNVDTKKTAKQFTKIAKGASCIFPISNISKRTFQLEFEKEGKSIDLIVYSTSEKKDIQLKTNIDSIVFTSPSNVESFFKNSPNTENNKTFIAMGKSTGLALEKFGITEYQTPKIPGEIGLIDCLFKI